MVQALILGFVCLFVCLFICLFIYLFQEGKIVQFEMDESQLSNILSSVEEIEKKLASYAQ